MFSASVVKIVALSSISLLWWELTCESIKLGKKIIFSSWQSEDVCGQHIDDEELVKFEKDLDKCEEDAKVADSTLKRMTMKSIMCALVMKN